MLNCDKCGGAFDLGIAIPSGRPDYENVLSGPLVPYNIKTLNVVACYKCIDCGRSMTHEEYKHYEFSVGSNRVP